MKKLLLSMTLLTGMSVCALPAQTNDNPPVKTLFHDVHLFKNMTCNYGVLDAGYLQGYLHGVLTRGGSMTVGGVINQHWNTGMWIDLQESWRLAFPSPVPVFKPGFDFFTMGWNNEFLVRPDKVINFSFPLHLGMGLASYDDRSIDNYYYTGTTYVAQPRIISRGYYFVAEPGANVFVNLFKCMSIGAGASYRFVAGYSGLGNAADLSGLSARVTLRFRMYDAGDNNQE